MKCPYNDYKYADSCLNVNYILIPVTHLEPNKAGITQFNLIVSYLENKYPNYYGIPRTNSGGIKLSGLFFPRWSITENENTGAVEIIILDDKMRRIQLRHIGNFNNVASGRNAFMRFIQMLKKFNINLEDYAIKNGKELKGEIMKPHINFIQGIYRNEVFENVHHIDFNNMYPYGATLEVPALLEPIKYMYEMRHAKPEFKEILNYSIGFMQSKYCQYKWTHIAKRAVNNCRDTIEMYVQKLIKAGRTPILTNTDGIWYEGKIYHDEREGTGLGQWKHDHLNCKFRAKSIGAYEFIENGIYYPVVRGYTNLDALKERKNWQWGDIYQAEVSLIEYNKKTKRVEVIND